MNYVTRRRRALMGMQSTDQNDYVTDGLALHLDAIDNEGTGSHNPNYYDWVDKAGERIFTQYPSDSKIAFGDNYYQANGSNYFECQGSFANWETMEVVIQTESSATMAIFQSNATDSASSNIGMASVKSGSVLFGAGGTKSVALRPGVHTYSCDRSNVYVDGVKETPSNVTVSFTGILQSWRVCRWMKSGYYFTGKLCSVRCYTRALSEEEIARNAAVDAARFA